MPQPPLHDVLELLKRVDPDDFWIGSKQLTRSAFIQEAHWAILVAGMRFATADEWWRKAKECGFPFDWQHQGDVRFPVCNWRSLAAWSDAEFESWCKRMAGQLVVPKEDLTGRFRGRWWAILDLGRYLAEFTSDAEFRERCFNGKEQGNELDDDDFHTLLRIKRRTGRLHGIGPASIWFIMRNLGGDFLKPDTWIKAFAAWYGKDVRQLARALRDAGIHCGEFDFYCWKYCEKHVRLAKHLPAHFDNLFSATED